MITEPTARHTPFSAYGVRLRAVLVVATLAALAMGATAAQPVVAFSSDLRDLSAETHSDAHGMAGPPRADGDVRSDAERSDGSSDASEPPDWHHYHHWTDPSWPHPDQPDDQDPAGVPWPAPTSEGHGWTPPITPPGLPHPPVLSPTTTPPTADPTETPDPGSSDPPSGASPGLPGAEPDWPQPGAQGPPAPAGTEPAGKSPDRDPVAAGPDDPDLGDDLGLGDPVDQPSPGPTGTTDPQPPPQAVAPEPHVADDYHLTLIFSGILGLLLALIGLAMVTLRRRRW